MRVVKGIFVIREWPTVFLVKCEMASFPVNCERTNLFSVKHDLHPPFTTL